MKKYVIKRFVTAGSLLCAFTLWTVMVRCVDVAAIGPRGSRVGFATLNEWFHRLTGVHMIMYTITDWLGLVPVALGLGFAILGLCQWIKRRNLLKVDADILVLGGFYNITLLSYLLFEIVVVNYRPVLIAGNLEASYPSSTTLLVLCIMPTVWLQLRARMRVGVFRSIVLSAFVVFTFFMVIGRLIAGVHWITDIVGGVLLSGGLVNAYSAVCSCVNE